MGLCRGDDMVAAVEARPSRGRCRDQPLAAHVNQKLEMLEKVSTQYRELDIGQKKRPREMLAV